MQKKSRVKATLAATAAGVGIAAVAFAAVGAQADDNTIIGGEQADNPWMVQLVFKQGSGTYGCSGEAIAPEWVLTARHCIRGTDSMNAYFSNDTQNRGEAVVVDRMLPSPSGDVALVHLSQPKNLDAYAKITAGYTPQGGAQAEIQGYGLMANKQKATHLNKASVQILGESTDAFRGKAVHIQGINGGSNHGDSGGPLLVDGVIVAVCSTGDTVDPGADTHATSNYANITASLPWIQQTAGVTPGGGPAPTGSTTTAPTTSVPTDSTTTAPTTSGPTDSTTTAPTETDTTAPTGTDTTAPTTSAPTPAPSTSGPSDTATTPAPGGDGAFSFTVPAGKRSETFSVLKGTDQGAKVYWSNLPTLRTVYVAGRTDGSLRVARDLHTKQTFTLGYAVETPDGGRRTGTVTLTLQ